MGKRRISALLAVLLVLVGMWGAALPAAAASETVQSGDKVAITGAEGHQYYYYTADGTTGYCWASYMCVAVSERGGVDVDYVNGDWKPYYAWCASWGEAVPGDAQEYLLSDAMLDNNGYYYVDENLHQNGVQGYTAAALEQSFSTARPTVTAAESLAATSRRLGGTAFRDYCNALSAKTELKLYIANAAVGAGSDKDFIAALESYGIKTNGDTYIMPDGRHISAATLGGEWSNYTEVKNVINEQDNRTYGGRRTAADGRAAGADSGGRTRDGERRAADATRNQQAATATRNGLREGDGQAGRIGADNGREFKGADKHIANRHGTKADSTAPKTGGQHGGTAGAGGGNAYGAEHSERDGKRRG